MNEPTHDVVTEKQPVPPVASTNLPAPRKRMVRGGEQIEEIRVNLEVVTPILGGSFQLRELDEIDIIRAPTVRGHLRFWWRALYAARDPDDQKQKLYEKESKIWGQAATDAGGRSAVEIRIDVMKKGKIDASNIQLYPARGQEATPGAYALWPARAEKNTNTPAPRRNPGTQFQLTLITTSSYQEEVQNALRAWILFGGYGSRTRRGLGSLKVLDNLDSWLPSEATSKAFKKLFGFDIFEAPSKSPCDVPWLCGAALQVGNANQNPIKAWTTALDWLKEFRQGTTGTPPARKPGTGNSSRPSISNWPEADKIRHLYGKKIAHPPRHNATVVWPRAGFGLPIIGRFQMQARDGRRYDEPGPFELRWRTDTTGEEHDRLASPLIVKALPLANQSFVPCALWLNRAYPKGEVILRGAPASAAPFDLLVAPDDTPCFGALQDKSTLREAFFDWLHKNYTTKGVAP